MTRDRTFLGIVFECCGIYARIYLNRKATAFEGRCPKCLKKVAVRLDPRGAKDRFMKVG